MCVGFAVACSPERGGAGMRLGSVSGFNLALIIPNTAAAAVMLVTIGVVLHYRR